MPPKSRRYPKFFEELAKHGNAAVAADEAKLSLSEVKRLRVEDNVFAQDWEDAVELARGRLEVASYTAALLGFNRPLHAAGKLTIDKDGNPVNITEYDTKLMMYLLDRDKPQQAQGLKSGELPQVRVTIQDMTVKKNDEG